jgi:hypothetical protein
VVHQYYPTRFKYLRDKPVGTIPIGSIIYIQDGVSPLKGLTRPIVWRDPWIVEAWIPRDYSKSDAKSRRFDTVRIAGGHLAQVRSLRNRRRIALVADWILLQCLDAGLEKPSPSPTSRSVSTTLRMTV